MHFGVLNGRHLQLHYDRTAGYRGIQERALICSSKIFHNNNVKAPSNMEKSLVQQWACILICHARDRIQCKQCSSLEEYVFEYIDYIIQ